MKKKWYMSLALLGIGSVGALLLSDRGRQAVRWVTENLGRHHEAFQDWNDAAQRELERLEEALNRVADSIEGLEGTR